MNNPTPLKPQGSFLEQEKTKTKSNLFIAVITILTLHVAVFGGLLIQGCKKDTGTPQLANVPDQTLTNELPPLDTNTLVTPSPDTNVAVVQPIVTPQGQVMPPVATPPVSVPAPVITPPVATTETPGELKEYKIAKNDSFYTIARAHHIPLSAIVKANPEVDPKKLKLGQVVKIPTAVAPAPEAGTTATVDAATTYVVKPNDTLTRVARQHNVTLKALRAANKNLKTDRLVVGQKLRIPAAAAPAAAPAPTAAGVPAGLAPEAAPANNPPVVNLPASGNP